MMDESGWRWGTHAQFARLYDSFLEAVYRPDRSRPMINGRRQLAVSLAREIKARGPGSILDCAAGTGFPSLDLVVDLANDDTGDYKVHCSDSDAAMADVLTRRAARRGVSIEDLTPPRRPGIGVPSEHNPLVLNWTQLERIPFRYDHVLCRGNSLAYADTWSGRTLVANDHLVATYLERMMRKVRPGGHLYVDAPWQLDLPKRSYSSVGGPIEEEVTADDDHREWTVLFKGASHERPLAFRRFSSLLTIDRVDVILKALGMEKTTPFQLEAERPAFGTIIARRPEEQPSEQEAHGGSGQRRLRIRLALEAQAEITIPRIRKPSKRRVGTHGEFVDRYERYLDAIYHDRANDPAGSGRTRLVRSIEMQLRQRRVVDVLDCAAGTGFPMVDLAAETRGEFRINCSDGDGLMIETLVNRANELGVPLATLVPLRTATDRRVEEMVLDWTELNDVARLYDYVLCRGNSLPYADTWAGNDEVASDALLTAYLSIIAARVRVGGYLHIDAPWTLDLDAKNRALGDDTIWEQVSADRDKREWRVTFTGADDQAIEFKRYSAPVTIHHLRAMLDGLGFEDTEPFALEGERESFGVIIAKKV